MKGKLKTILIVGAALMIIMAAGIYIYYALTDNMEANPEETIGPFYETEVFTVNSQSSLNHYIKAQFALELSNKKVQTEIEEKLPMLQDAIIMVLSAQSLTELNTVEGKEELKAKMLNDINEFLTKGKVTKIYLKNIVFS